MGLEKEKLFEQYKKTKEEDVLKNGKELPLEKEIFQNRKKKVGEYLLGRTDKVWGQGIKEAYPKLSDREIGGLFGEARHRTPFVSYGGAIIEISRLPEKKQKFKRNYEKFIYDRISQDAVVAKQFFEEERDELEKVGKFNPSMTNLGFQFKLAFNDFFEPVIRYKEEDLIRKIGEIEFKTGELGQQFNTVNQDRFKSKETKKKEGAEIQKKILETKKEISQQQAILNARKILSKNFILSNYPLEKLYGKIYKKFNDRYLSKKI